MQKLLVTKESPYLQSFSSLVERLPRKVLVAWAIECIRPTLALFECRHADDPRPGRAVQAAGEWAHGKIKMQEARRASLASHNAARDMGNDAVASAAAHAAGHVVGTVHVATHALGVIMYAVTAAIHAEGVEHAEDITKRECEWMYRRLVYWAVHIGDITEPWAPFLEKDAEKRR